MCPQAKHLIHRRGEAARLCDTWQERRRLIINCYHRKREARGAAPAPALTVFSGGDELEKLPAAEAGRELGARNL